MKIIIVSLLIIAVAFAGAPKTLEERKQFIKTCRDSCASDADTEIGKLSAGTTKTN